MEYEKIKNRGRFDGGKSMYGTYLTPYLCMELRVCLEVRVRMELPLCNGTQSYVKKYVM